MIVGKAIYNILSNTTAITDIVGTKIYPEIAPQNETQPYIVYSIVSNNPVETKAEEREREETAEEGY